MWILPSRQRIGNLKRFFQACREYGINTPGIVLVNNDELERDGHLYRELSMPPGWRVEGVEASCMQDAVRAGYEMVKGGDWIGLLQDDLIPGTPNWDTVLLNRIKGWNIVSSYDGRTSRMHGAIVWSGNLARHMGWLYPPGFRHLCGDDVWEQLSAATHCWQIAEDVITPHLNETYAAHPDLTAISIQAHTGHDSERLKQWMENEKAGCIARIEELKKISGVRHYSADFRGVKLLIATPTKDGNLAEQYFVAIFETLERISKSGGIVRWMNESRNSDIHYGRARILAHFLRGDFTHLLMIDADMGWHVDAVVRLFAAKKDFVAVAGPKKFYPLTFAASNRDDFGNLKVIQVDPECGAAEVQEVGMAFALITRKCAETVVKAFPETEFDDVAGGVAWNVFGGLVINRQYKAEDFAFCYRWRACGGKLYICTDVPLAHVGNHTFKGSLDEQPHHRVPKPKAA